jgi:hypothetical protein
MDATGGPVTRESNSIQHGMTISRKAAKLAENDLIIGFKTKT